LIDNYSFAKDSLFCEWTYVVDLDSEELEVYRGFNKSSVPAGERFAALDVDRESEYSPVRLAGRWRLDDLPSEDAFIRHLSPLEGEE
jgi:hypothetical protein